MSRFTQPEGKRGSLKWLERAVEERWPTLERPILERVGTDRVIEWRSPLREDAFAQYRDGAFLERVGPAAGQPSLAAFWPARGPQWDALGTTNKGEVLVVEAKAHVGEMCSPGSAAGDASLALITARLAALAEELGARPGHDPWTQVFYQLANRLAHLAFLRREGVRAFLVLANFVGDEDMKGPATDEAWRAAYHVATHVMGLPQRHPLSRFVIEAFPDVEGRRAITRLRALPGPQSDPAGRRANRFL